MIAAGAAMFFVFVTGVLAALEVEIVGSLVDLNLGVEKVMTSGPERLGMWGLGIFWGVGVATCAWIAQKSVHKLVRRQRYFVMADAALAVGIVAVSAIILCFGRA
jgi:hypothetical protein